MVNKWGDPIVSEPVILRVEGQVATPCELTRQDLKAVDHRFQIADVSRIDPQRQGRAVTLEGVLNLVRPQPTVRYLTLHASADDFHASVPLDQVRQLGLFIYENDGQPLEATAGGPLRFYIQDFAACHSGEIDECANVKFVDRIELSADKGLDTRPVDEEDHEELHRRQ